MTSQSAFSFPDRSSFFTQQTTFKSFSPGQTYNSTEPVTTSQPNPQTSTNFQNQQFQQYHTATLSSNSVKFPYLKKDEYETWAMKMEYWIMNTDHNLWKIIQNGNSKKSLGRDSKGGIIILPHSLPEDHMADFHYLDDAREIWLAVKARALPPSWSQVALTLKTRGGLEYLSFDDLYNKLRSLEIDVKGGPSYGSRSIIVAPTHSAFIGAASTNTKMVYSDQPSYSSLFSYTPVPFGSIMEDVLHSFVAENEPTQQLAYEDFEQNCKIKQNHKTCRNFKQPNSLSKKVEETLNLRYLVDKPNVQGLGQEWYFDLDYLTDSLGYMHFKTNPPAGTHDTNILAGTQTDDSDSECDEQVILVPSFPSNNFLGHTVHDVSAPMDNNLDYAEELARLQRQEYEAHSAAAKPGFEFFVNTAALLPQAEIEIHRNLVLAAGDPAGSIVSTGGVPAGSVPTSGVPAGSVPASSVPAGGVLAGSIVFVGFGDPAASASIPAVFTNAPAATSPLTPGHSLGSCKHTTRFSFSSDLGNHQPSAGIFSSSSYDDDFCADVTNLASNVAVDPVATKRVNTFHPQS
nr:ribonuclease H-like domain-containing protein [Tanacetum cinerariifolium]